MPSPAVTPSAASTWKTALTRACLERTPTWICAPVPWWYAAHRPLRSLPPAAAPKAQPEEAKAEDNYAQILNQLRALNDAIPGEEMSDKISRLEAVSAKIFAQAKQNPDKLPQMRKFMDYYLPTALKLLKTYAELDAQGVEGENIRESKQRIEQVMDTLVTAFEAQLDRLFEDDALDVSTDIDVMENMLRADGLTGNTGNSPKLQL